MSMQLRAFALAAVAAALLSACSTPRPARELAAQGAVAVDQAQTEVQSFVERATRFYRFREAIVRDLALGNVRDESEADFRNWLRHEAGYPGDEGRADQIRRVAAHGRESREKLQAALEQKAADIGARFGEPVTVPLEQLSKAKKSFINLSQELSPQEWLAFSVGYAKALRDDLRALEAPASAASAPAAPVSGPTTTP